MAEHPYVTTLGCGHTIPTQPVHRLYTLSQVVVECPEHRWGAVVVSVASAPSSPEVDRG